MPTRRLPGRGVPGDRTYPGNPRVSGIAVPGTADPARSTGMGAMGPAVPIGGQRGQRWDQSKYPLAVDSFRKAHLTV